MKIKQYDTEQPISQRWSQKKKIKNLATNQNGNTTAKFLECSKSSSKRDVHSNKCPPQETKEVLNNFTP